MGAIPVGTQGTYHSEHGDVPCWVVEYVADRPGGDYRVAGFWNSVAQEAGQGEVFSLQTVFGEEQGAFSVA